MTKADEYGVVFSGGGALGAWEVGCYKAIFQFHSKAPIIVTGSSAGALNAAGVAYGLTYCDLEKIWTELKNRNVYKTKRLRIIWAVISSLPYLINYKKFVLATLKKIDSFFDNEPLRETLTKGVFKLLDDNLGGLSNSNLAVSLSDIAAEKEIVKYKLITGNMEMSLMEGFQELADKTDFINSLVSSAAIPLAFPSNNNLFDGGVLDNQPIGSAIKIAKFASTLASSVSVFYVIIPSKKAENKINSILDVFVALINTWVNGRYKTQTQLIEVLKKIQTSDNRRPVEVITLRPEYNLTEKYNTGLLDFGRKNIGELINDGYSKAKEEIRKSTTNITN